MKVLTRKKHLSIAIVVICLILLFALWGAVMVFASNEDIINEGEMAGNDGIYTVFESYMVQDTARFKSKYIGDLQYTVYYDTAKGAVTTGYSGNPIIVYSVNHPEIERIGNDSNATIIQSMLDKGYIVIVLDYLGSKDAKARVIEYSSQEFRGAIADGKILTADIFAVPGTYSESHIVPSGYNILVNQVFFEIDKHSTSGTLEKIVENWNSDFKTAKGKKLVKWVHTDGTRKKVAVATDGTEPAWYNADGTANANGEYTYVKYTVAETVTDCVNPDGSVIDLDYYINVVYPTNPTKEVPVSVTAHSGGVLSSAATNEERPHAVGFLYDGYAGATFDFLWVPMARSASWGYYDGDGGTEDHINYGVQQYNDKLFNTAAMRYLRYISVDGGDTYKFDLDKFFVIGNSKGGWFNFLGEEIIQTPLVSGSFANLSDKAAAVDLALASLTPYKYYAGKFGQTRYQANELESFTADNITIDAGTLQPWILYSKDSTYDLSVKAGTEIISGIQVSYPSNGSQLEDITEGHTPIILGSNMYDTYNAAYGYSNHLYNICRELDIPLIHFVVPLGHTFMLGNDLEYNVDTYAAIFDYVSYFLKEEEIKVLYTVPMNGGGAVSLIDKITVKFAGVVTEEEIEKVTVSATSGALSGTWSSMFGGTEWIFTPDYMCGGTEYTINVPAGLKGKNGAVLAEDYTSTFITAYDKADTDISVTKNSSGTYYSFIAPALTNGNGFVFRFRTENNAANTMSLYAVDSVGSSSGTLLGNVRVHGIDSYEIDISDYIVSNSGKNVILLLKTDNSASNTVVKSESFDTYKPSATPDKNQPNKTMTLTSGASVDGKTALKISLENLVISKGVSQFYEKSNSLFSISDITGGIKTTTENYGRRFLIELDIYDTTSRTVRLALNRMTNRVDYGTIDYDNVFFSVNTKAGEWTHISFIYEMKDSDYGLISDNKTQKLTFYASTDGTKGSEFYLDSFKVTEIVTDVEVGYAAVAETNSGLGEYKAPENAEMPISIYNYASFVASYSDLKSALANYQSGYTIRLNADYTFTDSSVSDIYGNFATVNIDLNGYTLTAANTKNSLIYAKANGVRNEKTNINIYGGAILLGKTPLVSYESGSASGSGKVFDINLDTVNFGFMNQAFVIEMLSSSVGTDGVKEHVNFNIEDCSFVLRDSDRAKDGVVIFPASASEDLSISYTVKGGYIYVDSQKWVNVSDSASMVEFIKDENGEYTTLYAPISMFAEFNSPLHADGGYVMFTATDRVKNGIRAYTLEAGANCTIYGIIPDDYTDTEKYPFVLFDENGSFIGAYEKFYANDGSAVNAMKNHQRNNTTWDATLGKHVGANAVILVRRNYDSSEDSYYNWAQITGECTIDLGGFTITNKSDKNAIFDIETKASSINGIYFYPTTLNIINGRLETKSIGIVRTKANETTDAAANSIGNKIFTVNFDNVTFALTNDATASSLMFGYRSIDSADKSIFEENGNVAPYFINFSDCTFDITNNSKNSFVIFNANPEVSRWTKICVNVIGSQITADQMTGISIYNSNGANGSSVIFSKNADDEYIVIDSNDAAYKVESAFQTDDGYKYLVTQSEGKYTLGESEDPLVTKYGKLPTDYDKDKYPFALFFDGEFIGGFTHFANTSSSPSETGDACDVIQAAKNKVEGAESKGKEVYILLCRDYVMESTTYSTKELFYNWAQIGGTVVIDLNNHAITMGSQVLVYAECKTNYNSNVVFKNGTINTSAKAVVQYRSTTSMTESKEFNVTFNDITFAFHGSTVDSIVEYSNLKSAAIVKANVNLINCTIDLSKVSSALDLFNLNSTLINATVSISGGKMVSNSTAIQNVNIATVKTGNTVTFTPNKNGNYTSLYFPIGDTVTDKAFSTDKGNKYFVNGGTDDYQGAAYKVYVLGEKSLNDYIPKMSITLESQLVLNVYVPVNGTVKFTFNGVTYDNMSSLDVKEVNGELYYIVKVALPSSSAAKEIKLVVTVNVGESNATGTFTFSIPKYAKKILADTNATEVEKTLVNDVLAYIKAAYIYFDADDKTEVVKAIDEILGDYSSAFAKVEGNTDAEVGLWGVVIVLEEKPVIRFVLPEGVTTDGYTFKAGNKTLDYTVGTQTIGGKTHYYAEVSLYAYQMINEIAYTDGTNSGTWHINSYYDFVTTDDEHKDNANLISLVEKLYNYCKSAEAYRASVANK